MIVDIRSIDNSNNSNNSSRNLKKTNDDGINVDDIEYDFIFGYSTGHVGTTTLSEGRFYKSPSKVLFIHEMKYGPMGDTNEETSEWSYGTSAWKQGNRETDLQYVKEKFIPFLLMSMKKGKATHLVDLGHHNLYFIDALVSYLLSESTYKFLVVRIRRERLDRPMIDLCGELITRFCPYDRIDEVINKPPTEDIWNEFTVTQKALWIVDETEARWLKLVSDNPTMKYVEVYWTTTYPNSINEAALKIAKYLNLDSISEFNPSWEHMEEHKHAGDNTGSVQPIEEVRLLDHYYRIQMKYCYIPG